MNNVVMVGDFYVVEKHKNSEDYSVNKDILQVLSCDKSLLYVKDWLNGYETKERCFLLDIKELELRCLSDRFVAFVTGR